MGSTSDMLKNQIYRLSHSSLYVHVPTSHSSHVLQCHSKEVHLQSNPISCTRLYDYIVACLKFIATIDSDVTCKSFVVIEIGRCEYDFITVSCGLHLIRLATVILGVWRPIFKLKHFDLIRILLQKHIQDIASDRYKENWKLIYVLQNKNHVCKCNVR